MSTKLTRTGDIMFPISKSLGTVTNNLFQASPNALGNNHTSSEETGHRRFLYLLVLFCPSILSYETIESFHSRISSPATSSTLTYDVAVAASLTSVSSAARSFSMTSAIATACCIPMSFQTTCMMA